MVLDGIEKAFHPYVRDRGLDWEIHIEQVSCYLHEQERCRPVGSLMLLRRIGIGSRVPTNAVVCLTCPARTPAAVRCGGSSPLM